MNNDIKQVMWLLVIFLVLLALGIWAHAEPIKIAVIDTGLNNEDLATPVKLCKEGSYNFVDNDTNIVDHHGHGTNIAGIIAMKSKDIDYCVVVLKYYDPKSTHNANLVNTQLAIKKAIELKVDIINYSGGGAEPSIEEEYLVKQALDNNIKLVAAAGNESNNLLVTPYYPACYDDRIYAVSGIHVSASNYAKFKSNVDFTTKCNSTVTYWDQGHKISVPLVNGENLTMSGTSQATAMRTAKIVRQLNKERKKHAITRTIARKKR